MIARDVALAIAATVLGGCTFVDDLGSTWVHLPPEGTTASGDPDGPPDASIGAAWVDVRLTRVDAVDLLLVLDDGPGMASHLRALDRTLPSLVSSLEAAPPAAWHVGVVTADLGAGPTALLGCRPGGDGGALRSLGNDAPTRCAAPTGGVPWLVDDSLRGIANAPTGQDAATTLRCMAAVGSAGCAFQQPLEAMRRALHAPVDADRAFLRPDAVLAVLIVSAGDDCSAPADGALFDGARADLGPLGPFRCARAGLVCGDPPRPLGDVPSDTPLSGCAAVDTRDPAAPLYPLDRYARLVERPRVWGGLKDDPSDVLLARLAAPDGPVATVAGEPTDPRAACVPTSASCGPVLAPSCITSGDATRRATPALRLSAIAAGSIPLAARSICDPSLDGALGDLARAIDHLRDGRGCLPAAPADAIPRCTVEEVTEQGGHERRAPLPACGASGLRGACWRVEAADDCAVVHDAITGAPERLRLVVDRPRNGVTATVEARCRLATGYGPID